ncbi:MAG: flagellar filament capping protein FliD [Burkholderiaceae bacterium]
MGISSPGIGSNLDVNGIVTKLMQVESQPLNLLATKEASYQAKLSAYGSLSGALGSFQNALASLNNPSTFNSLIATPADASIFTASADATAVAGSYNVNVTQLAQAQTLATAGAASSSATIGAGTATTLTFQFGTISGGTLTDGVYAGASFAQDANQPSGTVTIDNTNNSLQGIRDAINKAGIGVTATIVSDGGTTPYHLVLTSNKTGATSSLKISVQGDAAIGALLSQDPAGTQNLTQTSAGQNTALTINGIAITSATTTVTGAIQGVTLNVAKTGSTTVSVARNTSAVQAGINGLVKAYNDLNTTIKNLTGYNADTKQGGPLLGDSAAQAVQNRIRGLLASAVTGTSGSLKTLSHIGLSFQTDGTLALDSTKLQAALASAPGEVAALFSAVGTTTDSLVQYAGSTSATSPGTSAVDIDKLATQGKASGDTALAASTIIDASNDQLTVTVDGVTATIALLDNPSGYTPAALAAQVQSAINGASALSSASIAVSASIDSGGRLVVTSNRYGSTSQVSVSGSAVAALFGTATSTAGIDVSGTIDGVTAGGSGQTLTGAAGSPSEGLKLLVTGGAEGASRGTVTFSRGLAYQLNDLIDGFIGDNGLLKGRTDGINATIKDIDKQRDVLNSRLADTEARYRAQFTALDTTISSMTATSTFLTQQLAQLANLSKQ